MEAALKGNHLLRNMNKTYKDIKKVTIRTQEAAMRIIDKQGPLYNYADRDHCIQYMTAIPLIYGRLTADDYSDDVASNPAIDQLRSKIHCVENKTFTENYLHPEKRSIGNALTIELNDGTVLDEIEVEYPVGHKHRRNEGIPLLMQKFERHLSEHFGDKPKLIQEILATSRDEKFFEMNIDVYINQIIVD